MEDLSPNGYPGLVYCFEEEGSEDVAVVDEMAVVDQFPVGDGVPEVVGSDVASQAFREVGLGRGTNEDGIDCRVGHEEGAVGHGNRSKGEIQLHGSKVAGSPPSS